MAERIVVVGVPRPGPGDGDLPPADLYVGGRRHLDAWAPAGARTAVLDGDLRPALDAAAAEPGTVCVLASGDPGFFGVVRPLASRFGSDRLDVRPAPSSVSLAFARLGLAWDDAVVVSAHGRELAAATAAAAAAACAGAKVAVLTSPEAPPQAVAGALLAAGVPTAAEAAVCSRLGLASEAVARSGLADVAGGSWDPLSVLVLLPSPAGAAGGPAPGATLAWGRPDDRYAHRAGMLTRSEVRAVVLAKLDLPAAGVVWDVGAGSGSVAVECALLAPAAQVFAVERNGEDAGRIRANAAHHGARVVTVEGEAPAALAGLPDPDRAFVGGGGLAVLDAVARRLRPGGTAVATYAAVDRAAAAADRLGSLVQVSVSRGRRLPDGSFRLAAENPVFVCWGPAAAGQGGGR